MVIQGAILGPFCLGVARLNPEWFCMDRVQINVLKSFADVAGGERLMFLKLEFEFD